MDYSLAMQKVLAVLLMTVLAAGQLGMAQVVVCSQTMDRSSGAGCCAEKVQPMSKTCAEMCQAAEARLPLAPNRSGGMKAVTDLSIPFHTVPSIAATDVLGLTEITFSCGKDSVIPEPAVAIFVFLHSFLI